MNGFVGGLLFGRSTLRKALQKHFGSTSVGDIATAAREFPITSRVDVQTALEQVFAGQRGSTLMGVHSQMGHETPTLAQFFSRGPFQIEIAPVQHDEVDVGDELPVRCLKNGLWLSRHRGMPSAVLLGPAMQGGRIGGIHVEVAVPVGQAGADFSQEFFRELELRVGSGRTYRGRVLSLESQFNYSGRGGGGVTVHRLRKVGREDVILPARTLALLEHNVESFVANRSAIKALRFSGKKGLLFYGPPGTGKTHTIHYLASQLTDHTTLLVTAEHLFFVGEYFRLARFLQPAIMVIEDVDLIARDRGEMHHPGQESLLNKLLNEMDGLREDADVLFILTTNRPDQLEPALAARPGRIDQAIEFPLPDTDGRTKLVALYARGLDVPSSVMDLIVRRTKGASPAFIKELMRRSAQFQIEQGGGVVLNETAVDGALEEMVFTGGALNLKLLGGAAPAASGIS